MSMEQDDTAHLGGNPAHYMDYEIKGPLISMASCNRVATLMSQNHVTKYFTRQNNMEFNGS